MSDLPQIHRFESRGLGKAPFQIVGTERCTYQACPGAPIQPGTTCDYCGTGISEVWWVRSSDGKVFKVGCDCVFKTGDSGLKNVVEESRKKVARLKRQAKVKEEKKRVMAAFDAWDQVKEQFTKDPHPTPYMAEAGHTMADYLSFLLTRGGHTGRMKATRIIEAALKQTPSGV